jgi:carbon starvation protein
LKIALREGAGGARAPRLPVLALITLVPLVWLLCVTFTAGAQKIGHPKPGIGFLAASRVLREQTPKLETALAAALASGDAAATAKAEKALRLNRVKRFNNTVDTAATAFFMVVVAVIVALSVREWILLLGRRKPAVLCETEPVWLPDYAVSEGRPLHMAGVAALTMALTKELSGEAELERAHQCASLCECQPNEAGRPTQVSGIQGHKSGVQIYLEVTEKRYKSVRRCC